jgi:NAD(P)-dependent dehydrogenase (short-subunit alcohol dehydrogenase family)
MSKVVLITGASAGMGREAAILLGTQGHTVYGGARRMDRLADLADHGVRAVQMDVSVAGDNERAVHRIIEDEGRIDVLINNAGFGLYGPVEEIAIDDARYQFEVNLFGLAQLTQLVLPHMRAQGSGRIVNISSMVGKVFTPMGAWYIATKHALEGWSDCLRLETAPFGIKVVLIEPGAIETEFGDVMVGQLKKFPGDSPYHSQIETISTLMENPDAAEHRTGAAAAAKVYAKAATTRRPRRRYITGALARPWMYTRKLFGDAVYEFTVCRGLR